MGKREQFWKTKSLSKMSLDEWESLCDGCGLCCLRKVEDEETGEIKVMSVSCDFLETVSCHCMVYADRKLVNPECIELSPEKLVQIKWLPNTCAYRCVAEGRELQWWHPLVSNDPDTVHQAGISARDKVVPGQYVHPEDVGGDIG